MIKAKTIEIVLMAVHLQKIAEATIASSTPSNGLDTANQKETSQPEF